MSKLVKNTFIYTIGNSLPMAVTFFLLPLYTKYLSPNEYGIIGTMESVKIIFTILFSLCVERSIVRLYWEYETDLNKKKFLGTVFFTLCLISISGFLIVLILKDSIQIFLKNINFYPYIFYTILISFLSSYEHLPKLYFRLKERAYGFVTLSFLYFFLSTGLIIIFVVFKKEGAIGYLKGQLIASVVMTLIYIYISVKISNINFNFKVFKNIFFYSLPFIPPLLVSWFINQSSRLFLENNVSLEAVGIYSFSSKLSIATSLFTTALMVSFEPNFYRLASGSEEDIKKIKNFFIFFMSIAIFSSFIFLLLLNELLFLFFDGEYAKSTYLISIITLSNIFGTGTGITGLFFQQSKKMIPNMFISLSAAIIILLLNYFLIPIYSIYGAAFSLLFACMYAFIISYYYTKNNCFYIELPLLNFLIIIVFLILIFLISNYIYPFLNFYSNLFFKISLIFTICYLFFKKYKSYFISLNNNIIS
jgi:O-antigen/teichoic acid export membrane protein